MGLTSHLRGRNILERKQQKLFLSVLCDHTLILFVTMTLNLFWETAGLKRKKKSARHFISLYEQFFLWRFYFQFEVSTEDELPRRQAFHLWGHLSQGWNSEE